MNRYLLAVLARLWLCAIGYVAGLLCATTLGGEAPPVHVWIISVFVIVGCFFEDFRRFARQQREE